MYYLPSHEYFDDVRSGVRGGPSEWPSRQVFDAYECEPVSTGGSRERTCEVNGEDRKNVREGKVQGGTVMRERGSQLASLARSNIGDNLLVDIGTPEPVQHQTLSRLGIPMADIIMKGAEYTNAKGSVCHNKWPFHCSSEKPPVPDEVTFHGPTDSDPDLPICGLDRETLEVALHFY